MTQTQPVPVCPKTKPGTVHPWHCVRAASHDGDCEWPIDERHYAQTLDNMSVNWLASEVRMLHVQIERMRRDYEEMNRSLRQRFGRLMHSLIELAPANSRRKTVPTTEVQRLWQEAQG